MTRGGVDLNKVFLGARIAKLDETEKQNLSIEPIEPKIDIKSTSSKRPASVQVMKNETTTKTRKALYTSDLVSGRTDEIGAMQLW